MLDLSRALVVPEGDGPLVDFLVVGNQHPGLADGQCLARHAGHGAHVAEGAHKLSFVPGAVGMRHVLDHLDAPRVGHLHDGVHVRRIPHVMHHHNDFRLRGNLPLDIIGIERQRRRVHVGEDDGGAEVHGL